METDTVLVLALVFLELPAAFILGYGLGTALEAARKKKERKRE